MRGRTTRIIAALFGLALVIAAVDFLRFARTTSAMEDAQALPDDAPIIILTGGSGLRIKKTLQAVAGTTDRHILISGVHPDITVEELSERTGSDPALFVCCVDVGHTATSTIGNADEAAAWLAEHEYTNAILVTSNYHMPRALIELRRANPRVTFTPHAVQTLIHPARWHNDPRSFRGMVLEWSKYRVTTLRRGRSE